MPPHQCCGIKADGNRCTVIGWRAIADTHPEHLDFCGTHKNAYNRTVRTIEGEAHHVEGRCFETVRAWGGMPLRRVTRWCPNQAEAGTHLCAEHNNARVVRAAHAAENPTPAQMARTLLRALLDQEPPPTWQAAAQAMHLMQDVPIRVRRNVASRYYRTREARNLEDVQWRTMPPWRFWAYWTWLTDGQVGEPNINQAPPGAQPVAPPPAPRDLARLAGDSQNVHTRVVTDQTNTATEKLLAVAVPDTQQTEKTMTVFWLGILSVSYSSYIRVAVDVNRWFNMKDCRAVGDNLYRRLLRGLVALINAEPDAERKSEMFRRLWEECAEATGMCCEGHISRLCNVLVGFDDAFRPPIPFGEILQSKMAAIAGLDVSEDEKRRQANAFFDEHSVPQEERAAWLEAF